MSTQQNTRRRSRPSNVSRVPSPPTAAHTCLDRDSWPASSTIGSMLDPLHQAPCHLLLNSLFKVDRFLHIAHLRIGSHHSCRLGQHSDIKFITSGTFLSNAAPASLNRTLPSAACQTAFSSGEWRCTREMSKIISTSLFLSTCHLGLVIIKLNCNLNASYGGVAPNVATQSSTSIVDRPRVS